MKKIARRKDVSAADKERASSEAENFADEKNKKYKLDTEDQIKAAWSYIGMPKNQKKYSAEDVKKIKAKIVAAWKKKIDKAGPPSAQDKAEKAEMIKSFHIALPLEKVVEGPNGEVFVEGFLARTDLPDKTPGMPEQMDEALSTPNFEKWIHETQERSDGKSLFNAREGHAAIMAGRGIEFKHIEGKGYWGKSEVVDPVTKEKVLKGVVTSHSVGGHYGKTWIDNGILKYEAMPIEVSYVDVGMIPGTEFQFQHADGSIEMRKFQSVIQEQPTIKEFIVKYAALKKDGGYEVSPEYARQEAWDIATAARVIEQATQLMSGEANEPEDAAEVGEIIQALLEFMEGETDEMVAAATGEEAEEMKCAACGQELEAGMKFCPMCGEAIAASEESGPAPDEAQEPETEAGNDGEAEAEDAEAETETETEPTSGLSEEQVKEIVRSVLTEMATAEKTERVGELAKAISPFAGKFDALEKGQKNLAGNLESMTKALAGDIATVTIEYNKLEQQVNNMRKAVESYGPVTRVVPQRETMSHVSALTEKDVIKTALESSKLSPQLRQAYQARLTELEIMETKPLEEPPTFIT